MSEKTQICHQIAFLIELRWPRVCHEVHSISGFIKEDPVRDYWLCLYHESFLSDVRPYWVDFQRFLAPIFFQFCRCTIRNRILDCSKSNKRIWDKGNKNNTYSKTSRLNCFCRLPRNSPIICLLKPFLCRRKWATPTGVSGMNPLSVRYWMPFSGFLKMRHLDEGKYKIWRLMVCLS